MRGRVEPVRSAAGSAVAPGARTHGRRGVACALTHAVGSAACVGQQQLADHRTARVAIGPAATLTHRRVNGSMLSMAATGRGRLKVTEDRVLMHDSVGAACQCRQLELTECTFPRPPCRASRPQSGEAHVPVTRRPRDEVLPQQHPVCTTTLGHEAEDGGGCAAWECTVVLARWTHLRRWQQQRPRGIGRRRISPRRESGDVQRRGTAWITAACLRGLSTPPTGSDL